MDQYFYEEMVANLNQLMEENAIQGKRVYLFGHCNATEELANLLLEKGFSVEGILDNNEAKYGNQYQGIEIVPPLAILKEEPEKTLVCIVARAYAAMAAQLKRIGYKGMVRKLVDYNTYAEYSLSFDTISRKQERADRGSFLLQGMKENYPDCFKILCPFSALGDIYFMMSYLPYFLEKREIKRWVVGVIGDACGQVARLFGAAHVEVLTQKDMDEMIQAALYMEDEATFIPHQDRPYVVNLSKALYIKKIPLEQIYCCGVFGLPSSTKPVLPSQLGTYGKLEEIEKGRSVIFSPYAKSVTALKKEIWEQIVGDFQRMGYSCYTNVIGEEEPLEGTLGISPSIDQVQSVVEWAGIFVGIRSGLCDVIREASCRKVALYPDYNYCDTKWKAIEMYGLKGWDNVVVGEGFQWGDVE